MAITRQVVAPNLPVAPNEYSARWHEQLLNIMRLFYATITNAINQLINGKIDGREGGWRDMVGQAVNPTGVGIATWTQIGSGPFYAYYYQVNDQQWFFYHIQHDYMPGTPIYLHTHWLTDGTNTNTVKWQYTWSFAKGFNQGTGSLYDTTGTVVTVEQAASGTAYQHMTSEIAVPVYQDTFEVDGILMVNVKRITNGGTNNTDTVFVLMSDCHYQSNTFNTKNRIPNFYN